MVYDAVGTLVTSISLFGVGTLFAFLGILFAISRSMTKHSESWALIFSVFAWVIALIIPSIPWASFIFIAGTIGITLAFNPIFEKMNDSNIFTIGIIVMVIYIIVGAGVGIYDEAPSWGSSLSAVQTSTVAKLVDARLDTNEFRTRTTSGLCDPSTEECTEGEDPGLLQRVSTVVFDVVSSSVAVATYIGKAFAMGGMALFMPFILTKHVMDANSNLNVVVMVLMGTYLMIWNMIIIYKMITFVLAKRQG